MGAIAGILYPSPFQVTGLIDPMLATLQDRSPAGGTNRSTSKNLQLGVLGGQTARSANGNLFAAIDGHLSNRTELQTDLKNDKVVVREKASDAEIILAAYSVWGSDLFKRIEGEYAVLIYDEQREILYLGRDRIGRIPLYWYQGPHHFLFGSELKSLLATGLVPQAVAMDGLAAYLYFGFLPQDMTAVPGANKLLPAHYLKLHLDGSKSVHSYWSYSELGNDDGSVDGSDSVDTLLRRHVKSFLPQHSSVACLVSGGLGSASVAYYASEEKADKDVTGVSVGFEGASDDDHATAAAVCRHLDIPHISHTIKPDDFLDNLVDICWFLDEPLADVNTVATWHLARLASGSAKLALSGMGSDELFAGHTRFLVQHRATEAVENWMAGISPYIHRFVASLARKTSMRWALSLLGKPANPSWQSEYLRRNALFNRHLLKDVSPTLAKGFDPEVFLHKFYRLPSIQAPVQALQYLDIKTRLPDLFMQQYERLMTAHRVQWRTPFLSVDLMQELAHQQRRQVWQPEDTAIMLRELMRSRLPVEVVDRIKVPRTDFLQDWADSPRLRQLFRRLQRGALVGNGLVRREWIDAQLNAGPARSFRHMWGILMLEIWYRLFIENPVTPSRPSVPPEELIGG